MKWKMLAGLTGLLAASAAAHAQSSVVLYGVIDDGLTYVSNQGGHHAYRMDDSISQGDRFGFRGVEDLGGGLKAVFNLEGGFNPNTGASRQGGLEFGRQAYVGLQSDRYGAVTLGRTYDQMTMTLIRYHSGYWSGIYAFDAGDHDRISGNWLNNVVTYTSPTIRGLRFSAQYSFNSQSAPANSYGVAYSLSASYEHGPLSIGAATTSIHHYTVTPGSSFGVGSFLGVDVAFSSTAVVVDRYRTAGIGASYDFRVVGVSALYTNTRYETGANASTMQSINAVVHSYLRPDLIVAGGYGYSRMSPYNWNEFNAVLDYLLSKRTDVYVSANYQKANGGARAVLVTLPASGNDKQLALRVGIRHKF
ncbi:porin [Paraburkholderia sabiae]|uniref:Porin n=1 Tax=Paraburkholderia sabiae TaxID=273251 RepID=A0ABU9QLC5_9BURK|nr:porin [Paraburkholderia sabiae]WJZ77346.1 porin [Paraburkholderia sabiae]CAD6547726.1 Outer membrane porin protein 32 [Paraburkholderia sabiae]